jgi:heat shock protein HslJ
MDEQTPVPPEGSPETEDLPLAPPVPQPMGWKFWAVMGLLAILICLIAYYQIETANHPAPVSLAGTSWTLAYYSPGNSTLVPVTTATTATLGFGPGNTTGLSGSAGCNQYGYNYTLRSSAFTVDRNTGTLTRMNCPGPGVMQFESAYRENLENTTSLSSRNDHLYLYDRNQKLLLIFTTATR